jgi:hypothetical protein
MEVSLQTGMAAAILSTSRQQTPTPVRETNAAGLGNERCRRKRAQQDEERTQQDEERTQQDAKQRAGSVG